jgi:hypothetical protein
VRNPRRRGKKLGDGVFLDEIEYQFPELASENSRYELEFVNELSYYIISNEIIVDRFS